MTSNAAADEIQQIIKAERQSNVNDISLPLPAPKGAKLKEDFVDGYSELLVFRIPYYRKFLN
jgi:hypothetical protein